MLFLNRYLYDRKNSYVRCAYCASMVDGNCNERIYGQFAKSDKSGVVVVIKHITLTWFGHQNRIVRIQW